ncbi:MAG: prolipoprotein diacylglyceryl transferase [Clostridiales Family XIII bacterium]|jgi:phosphatidylglycerol:prolipoprotein diacylglycerol transferase|nr:prolipoprotein diacylglyceryl transferase [Clostridiales Family XIII bacterium]
MESPGRVAFSVFGIDIMWYGVLIAAGILLAFLIIYKRAPVYHGLSQDRTFNFVILIVLAALVGTRLYYVVFNWDYYSENPAKIFAFRDGGLAIHGGLIVGALMGALLCRIYHERFLNLMDLCFTCIPLGQAIGRWGNFFNSEVYGVRTDLPWAVRIDGEPMHPLFLYESIWCFLLFLFLLRVDNRRKFFGQSFFLYCILYSVERFFAEGLRIPEYSLMVHFPWGEYRQAQVLSLVVIVAAAALYVLMYRRAKAAGFPQVNAAWEGATAVEDETGTEVKAEAEAKARSGDGTEAEAKAEQSE